MNADPSTETGHSPTSAANASAGGEPGVAVRRAPFADSPYLGPRGQRTRQRIVDAGLRIFGDYGYHQCSIDRITKRAGCSRASFYQYFSGKEDLFRDLAGQVARQLNASIEGLTLLTPDADGWTALRAWVERHAEIHARYSAVFHAFAAAAASDEVILDRSLRIGAHNVEQFRSSLTTTQLPPRRLDPVIKLLMECLPLTHDSSNALQSAAPEAFPKGVVEDAFTDVAHRVLFGRRDDVNAHRHDTARAPLLDFGPVMLGALQAVDHPPVLTEPRQRTRDLLMQAAREVFVQRGYHGTRVDDIAAAAQMSHGTFYRYFESTDELAHILAAQAMQHVAVAFADVPDLATATGADKGASATRSWLRRYNTSHATEAAVLRMWINAALQDPELRADSAAAVDRGRRQMALMLERRGFGDVERDAVVMVALLGAFGATQRGSASIDATAYMIERGLLGR